MLKLQNRKKTHAALINHVWINNKEIYSLTGIAKYQIMIPHKNRLYNLDWQAFMHMILNIHLVLMFEHDHVLPRSIILQTQL